MGSMLLYNSRYCLCLFTTHIHKTVHDNNNNYISYTIKKKPMFYLITSRTMLIDF